MINLLDTLADEVQRKKYFQNALAQIKQYESKYNALTHLVTDDVDFLVEQSSQLLEKPLAGLPVIIKDTFQTRGIRTTAGSEEYRDYIPEIDAKVVSNIKAQGGLIMGKSNTPTMAEDYQTFNDLFGITSNAINPKLTAGGSSGGSAVALALRYTDLAIGSDLGGSLRQPAAYNGVYSLRPSLGILSNHGQIPEVPEENYLSVPGPMGTSVDAVSLLFDVMRGKDPQEIETAIPNDIGLKIAPRLPGIPTQDPIVRGISKWTINLREEGLSVDIIDQYPGFDDLHPVFLGLRRYYLGKSAYEPLSSYLEDRFKLNEIFEQFLGGADYFVLPVTSIQPYPHNTDHSNFIINGKEVNYWVANGYYCRLASTLGLPVATFPIGTISGLPLGIQLIGKVNSDREILSVAKFLDKRSKVVVN